MRLVLDLQTEKDFWLGTYEPELQQAVREMVKPGVVVYDVGANIGYISLLLARAVGPNGRVFAFEALPDNVERLRRNLNLNPLIGPRVTPVAQAVTGQSGTVRFLVHASVGMGKVDGSAGRAEHYAGAIEVPGVCLDDFVFAQDNPPPQVIKIDIEGGEVLALPGMRRMLSELHPLLLMELHGPESARVAWETLVPLGYHLSRMQAGLTPVASLDELDWKAYLVARKG
jgi:FkbM family methyltransferase